MFLGHFCRGIGHSTHKYITPPPFTRATFNLGTAADATTEKFDPIPDIKLFLPKEPLNNQTASFNYHKIIEEHVKT